MDLSKALDILNIIDLASITKEELKKKYKKLMVKYHPDNCNGDDTKAKEISIANKIVIDALNEIESYNNLMKAANPVVITTVLPFEIIIKMYDGKTVELGKGEDKLILGANNMLKHNVYVMFDFNVTVDNSTLHFNSMRKIEMLRTYNVDCTIPVTDLGPLKVKVDMLGVEREFTINYDSIAVPLKFDNDIRVNITLRKSLISE